MKRLLKILDSIGSCLIFLSELIRTARRAPWNSNLIFEQVWRITVQSAGTTAIAGFFVGAIMTVQFVLQIRGFGALGFLGGLATSGTVREVGPLLIAFMLSGKIGAFTTAELGTMRVTEQLDAIRCLGINPMEEIVVPRFLGIIISSFFLLTVGLLTSIAGGLVLGMLLAGISPEEYLRHIPTIVVWPSVASGLFKCLVFAIVLASICTYRGYTTTGGAKGVGQAVVVTAVATMVSIVIADWFTTIIADSVMALALGT